MEIMVEDVNDVYLIVKYSGNTMGNTCPLKHCLRKTVLF